MNRLIPVRTKINTLKRKTNTFIIPLRLVNFNTTKVITVTEIAKTVKNPVFVPKIKKSEDITSPGLAADKLDNWIFSVELKQSTLKRAFTKNKINKVIETVFT